jgi:hypothetical protein
MTLPVTVTFPSFTPPPSVSLFQLKARPGESGEPDPRKTAKELYERGNNDGAPDVLKLGDKGRVVFTRAWQEYLVAINPNMTARQVAAIMDDRRWGFNGTGIPKHYNYIENNPGDGADPYTDKDRSMAWNIHAGKVSGGDLILQMFDGTKSPPPLSDISPQTHPYMYVVLTVVYYNGTFWYNSEWSQAAPVPGYAKNVTLFPLIANQEIRYPLDKVVQVDKWRIPY